MNDLIKQRSVKSYLIDAWRQKRFLSQQIKKYLHPQLTELFLKGLLHSHRYLQQHRIKQHALTDLPVCLVIGESQSGKSSLLNQSGLTFYPSEALNSRYQPIASRSMPHFRHTQHKIFVEMPTYLFINESNKHIPYLEQFLAFLQQFHYSSQIHEIVYTISLEKLWQKDEALTKQRDEFFAGLATLLSKLPHPVHCSIVLTKIDRLLGFNEFFDDLSVEERQLACGFSLHAHELSHSFQKQFQALVQRLTERLFWRCHSEPQLQRRLLVADFPQQFLHLQAGLTPLIQRFEELCSVLNNLKIKGFYTLSHLQQGHLLDALNDQAIPLKQSTSQHLPMLWQRRSFFVRGFFQHLSAHHHKPLVSMKKPVTRVANARPWWLSPLIKKTAASVLVLIAAAWLGYNRYQHYLSNTAVQAIEHNPSLAYALLTATNPSQALQAYVHHVAPNLAASEQQALVKDPHTQHVLKHSSQRYLNQMWQEHVYRFYQQQLAGHYPLDPASASMADIQAFSNFFGPTGLVHRFEHNYLNPSVLSLSADSQAFLNQVHRLQRVLFTPAGQMTVTFNLSPTQLAGDIRRLDVLIAGVQLTARPKAIVNVSFAWPNTSSLLSSGYVIQKYHGLPDSFNQAGPWSWLKVLQQFQWKDMTLTDDNQYEGSLSLHQGEVQLTITSKQDLASLLPLFQHLTPPESLYDAR